MRVFRLSVTGTKISTLVAAITLGTMCCALRAEISHAPESGNPSTTGATASPISHWAEQVVLGTSTADLTGPWKFHKGDNLQWAQPDYNDAGWSAMDLTPPNGSYDPFLGTTGFVPGWTALGGRGYSGYAWYRLQINVQYDPGLSEGGLEIKMPDDVDDAYQVFVNGEMLGQFGKFTKDGVRTYLTLPRTFALPRGIKSGLATIAIRVWMDPSTALTNPDAGGLHEPPILGQAGPIERMLRLDWDAVTRSQMSRFLELAVLLLAITVAIVLFLLDRKEKAYLWLVLVCAGVALQTLVTLIGSYTAVVPASVFFLLTDAILIPGVIGLWIIFWAYWFRMGRIPRLHKMVWGFTIVLAITVAMMRAPLYGRLIPVHSVAILSPLTVFIKLLLGGLLLWVAWEGMRKDHAGAWLAMPAVGLVIVSDSGRRDSLPGSRFLQRQRGTAGDCRRRVQCRLSPQSSGAARSDVAGSRATPRRNPFSRLS